MLLIPTFLLQKPKFCESTNFQLLEDIMVCRDYQEIKIQESTQVLGIGAIPRSIPVILMDDLVDMVKAGGTAFQPSMTNIYCICRHYSLLCQSY